MQLKVLYEDNHIIAVYKPAGLLVQSDETGSPDLLNQVKEFIKNRDKKPGNVFVGMVHRLDKKVSGIVLFGKTSKGAARLSEQFREHSIVKIYHAVVEGQLKDSSGTLIHYLKKDEVKRLALVSNSPKEGYDQSELSYKTILNSRLYTLISIHLKTGRFHQIRAQLSAIGHPIAGDKKYGSNSVLPDKSVALCATEITFKTATGEEIKNIKIDLPETWQGLV